MKVIVLIGDHCDVFAFNVENLRRTAQALIEAGQNEEDVGDLEEMDAKEIEEFLINHCGANSRGSQCVIAEVSRNWHLQWNPF